MTLSITTIYITPNMVPINMKIETLNTQHKIRQSFIILSVIMFNVVYAEGHN